MHRLGFAGMLAGLLLAGCAPLPVRGGPAVSGVVLDARSGRPVAGALVRVRHEGRYDQVLPERETLARGEATTDADGRFRVRPRWERGVALWPWLVTESRVVVVAAPGYRCAPAHTVDGTARIELEPAFDAEEQRASCPQEVLAALPGAGAPDAFGTLGEDAVGARLELGFGANCRGPAEQLTLAPDGRHAAFTSARGGERTLHVVGLTPEAVDASVPLAPAEAEDARIAWTRDGGLGIDTQGTLEVVWQPAPERFPAAPDFGAAPGRAEAALEAADLNDLAALRWNGRHFEVRRRAEPDSGRVTEWLRVVEPDGRERRLALPGEACSLGDRPARPQERIAADGETALDLRWVEGGCRPVAIDLTHGRWKRLDTSRVTGACRESRRVPAFLLQRAARPWALEVERQLAEAGLDPRATFTIELDGRAGHARIATRDLEGAPRELEAPPFPIPTPLRRIEVVPAGAASESGPPALQRWQPL